VQRAGGGLCHRGTPEKRRPLSGSSKVAVATTEQQLSNIHHAFSQRQTGLVMLGQVLEFNVA